MADENVETVVEEPVIVKVVDDEVANTNAADPAKTAADNQDPVLDLKQQLDAMTKKAEGSDARARAAESAARTAEQEVHSVRNQSAEAQYDGIVSGLEAVQAEIATAKREAVDAQQAGEYEKAADAQEKIGKLSYRAGRLEEAKGELEARKQQAGNQPQRRQPTDPVEAYVQNRSKQTADWLRAHPDYVTDPRKNKKLTAAHFSAEGDDLQPDTPEYFEHVEKFLGMREEPKVEDAAPPPPAKPAARPRPAVAPVNPTSSNGSIARRNEVTLTKSEAEAAVDGTHTYNYDDPSPQKRFKKGDPIGVQEFARRKMLMMASGHYDRTYSEQ
jgi:hypothetical protein